MSNSKNNNKKKVVDFSAKREKEVKKFLLLEASVHPVQDNELVDGEFALIKEVKRFGKLYYQVKNPAVES